MRLHRKVTHCLLVALVFAALVYRYPVGIGHEAGSDTTFIHSLSNSILASGYAPWIINPFSYFGLYALSYPSGIPFVFAATAAISGIPIEGVMLLFGLILSVPGTLGAYLAARRVRSNDTFALLVAVLFSFAPFYLKDTTWVGSSRGFVVALLPAFLVLLLSHLRTNRISYIALAFLLFVILALIHRMGTLAIFLLVAYVFAVPFHKVTQRLRFALARYERRARYATVLVSACGCALVVVLQYLYPGLMGGSLVEQYAGGAFFQGSSFPVVLANLAISLTARVGLVFPLMPFGLVAYIWHRPKEGADKFLLVTIVLFLPLLPLRDYIAEFLIFFFVAFLVFGLLSINRVFKRRRSWAAVIVALAVVGSVAASWEMKDYWRERYVTDTAIPNETYDSALYLRYRSEGTIIANEGLMGGRIGAISGRPLLPFGGASYHRTGPQQLIWGLVTPGSVTVKLIEFPTLSFNTDEIYLPVNVRNSEVDWETMLYYTDPAGANQQLLRYEVHYVVVDRNYASEFLSYGSERPSVLLAAVLPSTSYVVYESSAYTVWYR